ncbi:NUDIX hydrolase [Streptomyces sp. NPDC056323]|uniref:NUDIX hydrolase n=1 Tax=Streptomyces sp. NPDC056323 TaxID=3345784 RepID=UPI0035DB1193
MTPSPANTALLEDLTRAAERDGIDKTVVGAVIADGDGKVLLLHRTADDYLGGLWELPSGGVDDGKNLTEALRREVAEETGLPVAAVGDYLGHFDYRSASGRANRQFNFTATVTEADRTVKLTEHDAYLWADRFEQDRVSSATQAVLPVSPSSSPCAPQSTCLHHKQNEHGRPTASMAQTWPQRYGACFEPRPSRVFDHGGQFSDAESTSLRGRKGHRTESALA